MDGERGYLIVHRSCFSGGWFPASLVPGATIPVFFLTTPVPIPASAGIAIIAQWAHDRSMERKAYTEADVKAFAKHYDVPIKDARECWNTGGNWARAFDSLVEMYKSAVKQ